MMTYLENTLMDDETVTFQSRPHWIIYAPSVGWLLATLLVLLIGEHLPTTNRPVFFGMSIYMNAAIVTIVLAIVTWGAAWVRHQTSEYGITDKRVLMKTGLVTRISLEIFLDKIESIHVDQFIIGRILGYGQITVIGTGGSRDQFAYIPKPLGFRKKIQEQIEHFKK